MNWIDEKVREFDNACCPLVGDEPLPEVCIPLGEVQKEEVKTFLRTALEEARLNGYNAGLADGTGKPLIAIEMIREEARTQVAQEALAKVEEWVKIHKTITKKKYGEFDAGFITALDDLLLHLQQLKDNKEV